MITNGTSGSVTRRPHSTLYTLSFQTLIPNLQNIHRKSNRNVKFKTKRINMRQGVERVNYMIKCKNPVAGGKDRK